MSHFKGLGPSCTSEKFWSEKTDAKHYTSKGFNAEWPMFFMIHCQLELSTLVTEYCV